MIYYLDTCIWISILKNEMNTKTCTTFFSSLLKKEQKIYISTIILKELHYKLTDDKFTKYKKYIMQIENCTFIKTTNEDYKLAREYEDDDNYNNSFYDYIHIAIVKRLHAIFVSNDRKLLTFAKQKRISTISLFK